MDRLVQIIDPVRYSANGVSIQQLRDIRKLKARIENERVGRGADPKTQLKMGPGGLADVEWTIQLLQMRHGHRLPALRTTSSMDALEAAQSHELLSVTQARYLREAWTLASRIRNATMLSRARPSDSIPSDARDRGNVGYLLGRPPETSAELVDDWLRVARRATGVVEDLFWRG